MAEDEFTNESLTPEPMAAPLYVARAKSQARAKLAAEAIQRKRVLTRWLIVAFFAGAGISFVANNPDRSFEIRGLPMLTMSNWTEAPTPIVVPARKTEDPVVT